jgi:hypothetical protein
MEEAVLTPTEGSIANHSRDARNGATQLVGCTAEDLAWERNLEQASIAFLAGDAVMPPLLWARGLEIAERRFAIGDPRLACSLTNRAFALRREGERFESNKTFKEARAAWSETWRWIRLMTPGRTTPGRPAAGAESLPVYDHATQQVLFALAAKGLAATDAIEGYDRLPERGVRLWLDLKPKAFSDLRRLLGAVLLIVSRPR